MKFRCYYRLDEKPGSNFAHSWAKWFMGSAVLRQAVCSLSLLHRAAPDTKSLSATSAKPRESPAEPASCRTPSTGECKIRGVLHVQCSVMPGKSTPNHLFAIVCSTNSWTTKQQFHLIFSSYFTIFIYHFHLSSSILFYQLILPFSFIKFHFTIFYHFPR